MGRDKLRMMLAGTAILCLALAVAACNRDAPPPPVSPRPAPQAKTPAIAKPGPSPEALTVGMVEAVGQGKSQSEVQLKFELGQRPAVGQPLEINLALIPRISAGSVSFQVTGADGWVLAAGENQFSFPAVEPGELYRHTLRVTPAADGVLFVGLTATLKRDEITDTTAFSIPVIVER